MPVALTAAGAIRADAHEFRLMNGGGDIECPLGGGNYDVWEPPPCALCRNEEARGLELWKNSGPWAARRYAAYLQTYGFLSKSRDRAAQSPHLAAPPLFVKSNSPLRVNTPVSPQPDRLSGRPGATPPATAVPSSPESTTLHLRHHIPPAAPEIRDRRGIPTNGKMGGTLREESPADVEM